MTPPILAFAQRAFSADERATIRQFINTSDLDAAVALGPDLGVQEREVCESARRFVLAATSVPGAKATDLARDRAVL